VGTVAAMYGARARLLVEDAEVVADVVPDLAAGGLVVGDRVAVESPAPDRLRVVSREPRRTVLERADPRNPRIQRTIAANVDVGAIVLPVGPAPPRVGLVDRMRLALERGGVEALLVLNKIDLVQDDEGRGVVDAIAATYDAAGLAVQRVCATTGAGLDALRAALAGRTVVFAGHSGGGKSTLLNRLDPGGARPTGAVRGMDGKGRHTTTVSGLRVLDDGTRLVDTPGIRELGVEAPTPEEVERVFPDLFAGAPCRFADCTHRDDEGCAVPARVRADPRLEARLAAYRRILEGD
jgi:ribosome biogenesis GTPase